MSRVGMMELLGGDSALNNLGITEDNIWPNFALDRADSSRSKEPWLVLRWGEEPPRFGSQRGGKVSLTVWAYQSRQVSTDFSLISEILRRVALLFATTEQYVASDDSVISTIDFTGMSQDLEDQGYDAITKSASFTVVTRTA